MKLWNPLRPKDDDPITRTIEQAAKRNDQQAARSRQVHEHLAVAVDAEQAQIRANGLGSLLHVALASAPRRRHT